MNKIIKKIRLKIKFVKILQEFLELFQTLY